jgi:hypothetical protein
MPGFGFIKAPEVAVDDGEVVPADECVRVLRAEHFSSSVQNGAVPGFGFIKAPEPTQDEGETVVAGKGLWVLGPQHAGVSVCNG